MTRIASSTDRGIRRPTNQDAHCLRVARTSVGEVGMVAVCDGVGGLAAGELASSTVARMLMRWFAECLPGIVSEAAQGTGYFDPASARGSLERLVEHANEGIWRHGENSEAMLGTTLTAVLCCDGRYLVVHVGDTRAYLVGQGQTLQLTRDQTVAQRDLAAGRITANQLASHPGRSVLLQAIGTQPTISPTLYGGTYALGDLFVVCCDGAWHQQGLEGISQRFTPLRLAGEGRLKDACQDLVQDDIARGETDNITVAVLGPDGGDSAAGPEPLRPRCLRNGTAELAERNDPNATARLDRARRGIPLD